MRKVDISRRALTAGEGFFIIIVRANVAELADASDLGSDAARRGGSSPPVRTNFIDSAEQRGFSRCFFNFFDKVYAF